MEASNPDIALPLDKLSLNDGLSRSDGKLLSVQNIVFPCVILLAKALILLWWTHERQSNIITVGEVVLNGISSTGLRDCISRGLSVKYLTADEVIDYIKCSGLYVEQKEDDTIDE